jgi:hypothetical protein
VKQPGFCAAEVRISRLQGELSASEFATDDWKGVPQGLKSLRENYHLEIESRRDG